MKIDRSFSVPFVHRLRFTNDAFSPASQALDELLVGEPTQTGEPTLHAPAGVRVLFVLDAGLEAADRGGSSASGASLGIRDRIVRFVESRRGAIIAAPQPLLVPGGEACKNDPAVLESILHAMQRDRICRRSYLVVVGGGAVLDVAGYAASIFHRGVRLVRIPSTTLAQDDSGVGVKSGVNWGGIKNLVGAFWPPWGVINDESLLHTLTDEHWRSGFSEAVKVALLKDAAFFETIERDADRVRSREIDAARTIIRRSAILHMNHITGEAAPGCDLPPAPGGPPADPFELRSARPLDFGHWAAHRLEAMTRFTLTHGHAVGIGMVIDCEYARRIGACDASLTRRVRECLTRLGLPVRHDAARDADGLMRGIDQFREHLGGRLTVTLITRPGESIDVHTIDDKAMREAIATVA